MSLLWLPLLPISKLMTKEGPTQDSTDAFRRILKKRRPFSPMVLSAMSMFVTQSMILKSRCLRRISSMAMNTLFAPRDTIAIIPALSHERKMVFHTSRRKSLIVRMMIQSSLSRIRESRRTISLIGSIQLWENVTSISIMP